MKTLAARTEARQAVRRPQVAEVNRSISERLPWLLRLAGERGILPLTFSLEPAERA